MELRISGKYKITKRLGKGAFGDLFSGINLKTGEEVAIKLEQANNKTPMLQYEAKIYEKLSGEVGIPQLLWYGVEGDYNIMVIDILGPSLAKLFDFCDGKFELKTLLWIAISMIQKIEILH